MSTVTHSLGEFEHIIIKRQVKIGTSAELTLHSLDALYFPFSVVFERLKDLVTSKAWISSHCFILKISLHFDSIKVEGGSFPEHAEHLGLVLQDAEVVLMYSPDRHLAESSL